MNMSLVPAATHLPAHTDNETRALVSLVSELTAGRSRFADDLLKATKTNTKRAYAAALRRFILSGGPFPATPDNVAHYVRTAVQWTETERGIPTRTDQPLTPSTLSLHVSAIGFAHRVSGHPDPTKSPEVEMALKAQREDQGTDATRRAKPLLKSDIITILNSMNWQHNLTDLRDAALLLLGFSGAFRRSELAALNLEDISYNEETGMLIRLKRSKRKTAVFTKAIHRGTGALCPVRMAQKWILSAPIVDGKLFRGILNNGELRQSISGKAINDIVQRRAEQAGLDMVDNFDHTLSVSAHSLRAGFVTEMRKRGVPNWQIMRVTGHVDEKMLQTYHRDADMFSDNPTLGLW